MQIVDANVLLYAVNASAVQHDSARTWLDRSLNGDEPVGFAWVALLAFLRLATHPAVFPHPLDAPQGIEIVRSWLGQPPSVVVEPTSRHLDVLAGLLVSSGTAANLVSDAHLAALAIEHDARLVSFDADFGRFDGLRWTRPGR